MRWILVDIALAVLALLVLGLVGFRTFRRGKDLAQVIGTTSRTLGAASEKIVSQGAGPDRSSAVRS